MSSRKRQPALPAIIYICLFAFICISGPYHQADATVTPLFGQAKVRLSAGDFPQATEELKTVIQPEDVYMLGHFSHLRSADFSGSTCYSEISRWSLENPEISVTYSVALPDGRSVSNSETQLDLSTLSHEDAEATAAAMKFLPNISSVELGSVGKNDGSITLSDLAALRSAMPEASFDFTLSLLGEQIRPDTAAVDLSGLEHSSVGDAAAVLSCLTNLKEVTLGSESSAAEALTWEDVAAICAACPEDAAIDYGFTIYGKECNLMDEELDLSHMDIGDEGGMLKKVLPCMERCAMVNMDSTGVSNEAMALIRDENPDVKVVWRIWFGENYSVRTDTEKILASKPTVGGMISDAGVLKYCTEIKYLDLGHNEELYDLSYVANMPKLEVLIIAMTGITDISYLENCPELNYLELNTTGVADISVLKNCTKLRDLNIGDCRELTDISALFEIPLDRLWIGCNTPVPAEQAETMRANFPDCVVNTSTFDPHGESWRYTAYDPEEPKYYWVPRYERIRSELGYDYQEYSFYWLDPYCELAAPAEYAGMYGREVYG